MLGQLQGKTGRLGSRFQHPSLGSPSGESHTSVTTWAPTPLETAVADSSSTEDAKPRTNNLSAIGQPLAVSENVNLPIGCRPRPKKVNWPLPPFGCVGQRLRLGISPLGSQLPSQLLGHSFSYPSPAKTPTRPLEAGWNCRWRRRNWRHRCLRQVWKGRQGRKGLDTLTGGRRLKRDGTRGRRSSARQRLGRDVRRWLGAGLSRAAGEPSGLTQSGPKRRCQSWGLRRRNRSP